MIDNYQIISPLLSWNLDEFYFIQVIQRKKDNPNIKGRNNNNRLIKSYNITSLEHLDALYDEMRALADVFNARIGINLNKRTFEKTAFNTLKKMADCMHNRDFKNVRNAWNHACGIRTGGDKLWIVDVDDLEGETEMIAYIRDLSPEGDKHIATIPSKNGFHLITKPFNIFEFTDWYPQTEIHKNNPTNLYIL